MSSTESQPPGAAYRAPDRPAATERARGPGDPPHAFEVAAFVAIRSRRRWVWTLFFTYLPGVALINLIQPAAFPFGAIAWMIAFGVAGVVHGWSRCPRCRRLCFQRTLWSNPWSGKCLHCQTRLYWSDIELRRG